jgi:hypothetical protein
MTSIAPSSKVLIIDAEFDDLQLPLNKLFQIIIIQRQQVNGVSHSAFQILPEMERLYQQTRLYRA